jgi:hypothetical protein
MIHMAGLFVLEKLLAQLALTVMRDSIVKEGELPARALGVSRALRRLDMQCS